MTREPPFFECPDCGKDIASSLPHAADCPQAMTRKPDIATRLRDIYATHPMLMEAAAEIEWLKADNKRLKLRIERLRAGLENIAALILGPRP